MRRFQQSMGWPDRHLRARVGNETKRGNPDRNLPMNHKLNQWAAGLMLFVLLAVPALGADRTFLPNIVPPIVVHLTPIGPLPATNHLRLAFGLPLHHHEDLPTLLQQMYDPDSTNFHRYLSPEQFTAKFGPTEADYQKVLQFARSNGLAVVGTYGNRQLVDVSATVADVEKTFQITLYNYQHPTEHRVFYVPDTEPSVPAGVPILCQRVEQL